MNVVFLFFFQESLKICSRSNYIFWGLTFVFFFSSFHFFVKRRANTIIEQLKCKDHEKRSNPNFKNGN